MRGTGSFVIGSLFMLTIGLVLLGIIMVLSSSQFVLTSGTDKNVYQYMGRQLMWFSVGLAAMGFFAAIDYNRWERYARPALLISTGLLGAVLIFGPDINGAKRWLIIFGFQFQPSEVAKIAVIWYLASVWAERDDRLEHFYPGVFYPMLLVGFVLLLIVMEPDNGTTFFIGITCAVLWYAAGGNIRHMVPAGVLFCSGVLFAIYSKPRLYERILAYLNPEDYKSSSYYQVYQATLAFAHGGFWGAGLGEGQQQLGFTPYPHTDFIFSTMGEELGFVKCSLVLLAFLGIILLGLFTAIRSSNPFGSLLAVGCTTAIGAQAAINIAVVTGSIPNTGIALPFLSYGGSSLMVSMSMVGMIISVARETFAYESSFPRSKRKRHLVVRTAA
ncbi:MAG: putative lipid II flippase FtsW [bacterium]|jgi:cell division protein FtsW